MIREGTMVPRQFVSFVCPEDDTKVNILGAGLMPDDTIQLIGVCPSCKAQVRLDIEQIIVQLMEVLRGRGN